MTPIEEQIERALERVFSENDTSSYGLTADFPGVVDAFGKALATPDEGYAFKAAAAFLSWNGFGVRDLERAEEFLVAARKLRQKGMFPQDYISSLTGALLIREGFYQYLPPPEKARAVADTQHLLNEEMYLPAINDTLSRFSDPAFISATLVGLDVVPFSIAKRYMDVFDCVRSEDELVQNVRGATSIAWCAEASRRKDVGRPLNRRIVQELFPSFVYGTTDMAAAMVARDLVLHDNSPGSGRAWDRRLEQSLTERYDAPFHEALFQKVPYWLSAALQPN